MPRPPIASTLTLSPEENRWIKRGKRKSLASGLLFGGLFSQCVAGAFLYYVNIDPAYAPSKTVQYIAGTLVFFATTAACAAYAYHNAPMCIACENPENTKEIEKAIIKNKFIKTNPSPEKITFFTENIHRFMAANPTNDEIAWFISSKASESSTEEVTKLIDYRAAVNTFFAANPDKKKIELFYLFASTNPTCEEISYFTQNDIPEDDVFARLRIKKDKPRSTTVAEEIDDGDDAKETDRLVL